MLRLSRLVLALFTLVAFWPAFALAQTKAGVVTTLQGSATAARTALPQPVALKFKDDVFQNDRIVTGDQSIVRLLLGGKAVVTVRERSSLTITEVPGKSTIDLDVGKIAVAVAKEKMRPGESIEVKTPNAVAAVRGTAFIVEVIRASASADGAQLGVVTNIFNFVGELLANFLSGQTFTMGPDNFAGALGPNLATFRNMTPEERQSAPAGLTPDPKNVEEGQAGAKDQAVGASVATFDQGGGLPQLGDGDLGGRRGGGFERPVIDPCNPGPCVQGVSDGGGGFKPSGTPTAHLIFGDRGEKGQLQTDLQSLGKSVTMNVSTLPNDLTSFGTIWHVGAFVALTSAEQSRLSSHLARGRGLHLTGERPCCDTMNASLTTFVRSVVSSGSDVTVGNQGDIGGPYTFNSTARGNVSTNSNNLTTWNPSAPGGIVGPFGALEREQEPAPDLERVLERLEAGRVAFPVVAAEVGVPRA